MSLKPLTIIGERINPGFKSSKALFENSDLAGIQALAKKQQDAGAAYVNINIGSRALTDQAFMRDVVMAIQDVVDIPLSFDFPSYDVQQACMDAYDSGKSNGRKPIINSISEHRTDMMAALDIMPSKVIIMASERMEDGVGKANKTAQEVHEVAKRLSARLIEEHSLTLDDIIVDVSISTLASDNQGLTKMALDGIRLIGEDPDLKGIHMMGGISNVGMMLPKMSAHGIPLGNNIERAFLTIARPLGFDTVLGTPWHSYEPLEDDNPILQIFNEVIELTGNDALRAMRKFYKT